MNLLKTTLLAATLCGPATLTSATTQTLSSPDGHLTVLLDVTADGVPTYSVLLDADTLLCPSPLGVNTSIGDYTRGLTLVEATAPTTVSDHYTLRNAKKSDVSYTATEATYHFADAAGRRVMEITFHVDNSNVAFRYGIAEQKGQLHCRVLSEASGYNFPVGTTTFLCPQMGPNTGFAATAPSYETFYTYDDAMGRNGQGAGYTFPALFRCSDKGWVMLTETDVDGNYCASRIESAGPRSYRLAYPLEEEFGYIGQSAPGVMLPGSTPWRTLTVGRTLQPIAETTIMWDLVTPRYAASEEYRYGRSVWSWIIRMDSSCNFDEQKEYIDFAADLGWEYILIDALWDTQIGRDKVEELVRYAAGRGVGVFLWYNSNGYWNDAPQGPRGRMHRLRERREEMDWMQALGVKGIKVDFFGGDKQMAMQLYEDILYEANAHHLMVIFHGCTIPRGWERMFPNFVACEAVRASENLSFGQHDCDVEAQCGTMHPILRNAIGNMDFGGSALNKHYSTDNRRGKTRRTSDVYALATAILFQSPIQNFALAPNNLTDAPAWAIDFMRQVPTTWDDVRFLDGYPGRYLVMARRAGDRWYVAGINAESQPLRLTLTLPMFSPRQQVTVYDDTQTADQTVRKQTLSKRQTLEVTLPTNGGVVIY
jgi:hypothetical protein